MSIKWTLQTEGSQRDFYKLFVPQVKRQVTEERMKALIGYTGFVGSNLIEYSYNELFNSKNIAEIIGKEFDIIVCAGIRAEKYLANMYPEQDLNTIKSLIEILKQVSCKKFILISTIDIYINPINVNEKTSIVTDGLHPYGANRHYMEEFVRNHFKEYLIVRLPALFGKGLKKNFIYDLIHKIPSMIMEGKFSELVMTASEEQKKVLQDSYYQNEKGNWEVKKGLNESDKNKLKDTLEMIGFTSLVFTDHRSKFPFYDLSNLQSDIDQALKYNIKELNIAIEPVSAAEVAKECFGVEFTNEIYGRKPVYYDMKTIYSDKWNGNNGYMYSKEQTLSAIKKFVEQY